MVCKECEKSIAKNSNYCKYCGTKVEKQIIETISEEDAKTRLLFKEVQITEDEANEGAERILNFKGAVEPLHIIFPKLFCTGQLFMVKKYKFLTGEGKYCKKNILIRVNIA